METAAPTEIIELSDSDDGGGNVDDCVEADVPLPSPPAEDDDALVPDHVVEGDAKEEDGDWPPHLNACFDECRFSPPPSPSGMLLSRLPTQFTFVKETLRSVINSLMSH